MPVDILPETGSSALKALGKLSSLGPLCPHLLAVLSVGARSSCTVTSGVIRSIYKGADARVCQCLEPCLFPP